MKYFLFLTLLFFSRREQGMVPTTSISKTHHNPRDAARKKIQQNQVSRNFFGRNFGIPFSIKDPSKIDYDFPKILVGF